jgi:hypothetical protein
MNRYRIVQFKVLALVLAGALLLGVSACVTAPRTINVANLGRADRIEVYENGKPVLDRVVTAGSAPDRAVTSWLESHATGWRPTLVTFAPVRHVRGESFDLNFLTDQCVLNYRLSKNGNWIQVIRPLEADDPIPRVFRRED